MILLCNCYYRVELMKNIFPKLNSSQTESMLTTNATTNFLKSILQGVNENLTPHNCLYTISLLYTHTYLTHTHPHMARDLYFLGFDMYNPSIYYCVLFIYLLFPPCYVYSSHFNPNENSISHLSRF